LVSSRCNRSGNRRVRSPNANRGRRLESPIEFCADSSNRALLFPLPCQIFPGLKAPAPSPIPVSPTLEDASSGQDMIDEEILASLTLNRPISPMAVAQGRPLPPMASEGFVCDDGALGGGLRQRGSGPGPAGRGTRTAYNQHIGRILCAESIRS
jgi:hypothetical protein